MTRSPTPMLSALAVFVVLFAVAVGARWYESRFEVELVVEASLDLGESELSGLRTGKCFSPDGSVFFDARGSTVQAWIVDDRPGTDDDRAIHAWKDTYGGSDVALASREVQGPRMRPAVELAVLAKQKKTIRFFRFHHTPGGVGFADESFSVEYPLDAHDLGEAVRIAYRPRSDEFLVFFESGQAKRFSISAEGEVQGIQWFRSEAARKRGTAPADSLRLHGGSIDDAAFSPDGRVLATVNRSRDRFVSVVSLLDETVVKTPPIVDDVYYSVGVSARGDRIAAARGKGPIDVFRRAEEGWTLAQRLPTAEGDKAEIGLAFAGEGREIVAVSHHEVHVWHLDTGRMLRSFESEDGDQIQAWSVTNDDDDADTRLLLVDKHGMLRGWEFTPDR